MKLFCGFIVAALATTAHAGVIVQNPLANPPTVGHYIAFEAESYDSVSDATKWTLQSDPAASGNAGMYASATSSPRAQMTYLLRFTVPGDYYFYARVRGPGQDPSNTKFKLLTWDNQNLSLDVSTGANTAGYYWYPGPAETSSTLIHFNVAQADLGRDIPMVFAIKNVGPVVDRIVLSDGTLTLGSNLLDPLANSAVLVPEPGAMMLSGVLLATALACRPRRTVRAA